ncbi:hypothetical protein HNW13_017580 [Shewanella sp. BF02_Schw]|uniref:hypothetical protein n=1 Tax=Shewanella sp. BF02_Schw TaxID=394908 RepID=UPI00177F8092|nr:hypothetical protein [Shewanella sp. BF02_Schw]MBO1897551.1 hypothetical protein [Shewanella sp. BF02_Schw]
MAVSDLKLLCQTTITARTLNDYFKKHVSSLSAIGDGFKKSRGDIYIRWWAYVEGAYVPVAFKFALVCNLHLRIKDPYEYIQDLIYKTAPTQKYIAKAEALWQEIDNEWQVVDGVGYEKALKQLSEFRAQLKQIRDHFVLSE